MRWRHSLILIAILFSAGKAGAQVLIGRALDNASGMPVTAAEVQLLDREAKVRARTITDSSGWFRVAAPAPGRYIVQATTIGYAPARSEAIELADGIELSIELRLSVNALPIAPVRVLAQRSIRNSQISTYYDRADWSRKTGLGRVIMRDEIERMGLARVGNLLVQYPPRAACRMTYMLDGMTMNREDIDRSIMPEDVEGVEIYRSSNQVPVEFATRTTCGLVLIWTRHDRAGVPFSWRRFLILSSVVGGLVLLLRQ
jgi:hypothetical protein